MSITSIYRDWSYDPALVRIVSTNTLAQVVVADYITAQADNIEALNSGAFQWNENDGVFVRASDGWGFFSISSDFTSLDQITSSVINGSITLAKLASGIAPSHIIKYAGQVTTVGGAAAEAFTVTGAVAATDRAFVQVVDKGTANVTVLQAVVTNNTLTVTFSGNPGADTIINYQLIRATS